MSNLLISKWYDWNFLFILVHSNFYKTMRKKNIFFFFEKQNNEKLMKQKYPKESANKAHVGEIRQWGHEKK